LALRQGAKGLRPAETDSAEAQNFAALMKQKSRLAPAFL